VTLAGEADRRGLRAVLFLLGLMVLAAGAWVLFPRMLDLAGGPESEIRAALKAAERARDPIRLPARGAPPLRPGTLSFDRLSITVEPNGKRARVVTTLDAAASLEGVTVSSLGREQIRFSQIYGGVWQVNGSLAPVLSETVGAMWRRAQALDGSSATALGPLLDPRDDDRPLKDARLQAILETPGHHWEPRAWYVRVERTEVLVTEEAVLHRPGLPDEPRTSRLRLRYLPHVAGVQPVPVPEERDGSFVFLGGVL